MNNPRIYGIKPFGVAVIHGGPGAPGEMAPVARELASVTGILEPLQTASSLEGQVEELHVMLKENGELPVILIGWSWGAMLSFIFTARYPSFVKKLILIGSGPYEERYAEVIMPTRLNRMSEEQRVEFFNVVDMLNNPEIEDKNTYMARFGDIIARADSYDPLPHQSEMLAYQYDINQQVWQQASQLRGSGKLLELGKKIRCPVVAIHGDYDSHPAEGVREPLSRVLKDFSFILLEKCGHEPWVERYAKDRFYKILKEELKSA
jgi:pimeloyl-ACP methyl ester carboxylesterase